jgi:hypothetical protein
MTKTGIFKQQVGKMNHQHELHELEKPLTKGDFLIYQYEKRKDFYLTLSYLAFVFTIVLIINAIYDFFSDSPYFGIDKILIAVFSFLFALGAYRSWSGYRRKIMEIEALNQEQE